MPGDGIAVVVYFSTGEAALPSTSPRSAPTTVTARRYDDTPEHRIFGHVWGVDVNIFVDIRRLPPTRRRLRAVQRVVSSVGLS